MTDTIPNLWPSDFKVDVQTPYAILKVQAELLGRMTRGILQGTIETEKSKDREQHRLVVIAPACNGYRHTLITAIHSLKWPYPVEVRAAELYGPNKLGEDYPEASDDGQMAGFVQTVLRSDSTRAIISSLIAKSNEPSDANVVNGAHEQENESESKD